MPGETSYLPWNDTDNRYYSVGKLMRRNYIGGDRETLTCPVCDEVVEVIVPSIDGDCAFEAHCKHCDFVWYASRAVELWDKIVAIAE